ncbi:MAG: UDP-glucose 4-epimerase GalE [Acidimicrobiia bacterium]
MTWLVTGGAGYIGAHVVRQMRRAGRDVVVLDDMSTGDSNRLPAEVPLVRGSVLERSLVDETLRRHDVHSVIHIAAKKQVAESVAWPLLYWRQNVDGLLTLLEACYDAGVDRFVFSSSAAVYGVPDAPLVTEEASCRPVSPYGETKVAGERLLRSCTAQWPLRSVSLRYFNVAGAAHPELADSGVFNLIPMVFERLQAGKRPLVFGADYATDDGSCVRDFVHVSDVARAHVLAAEALDEPGRGMTTYNIGRGQGASVFEVLRVIGEVSGLTVEPEIVDRRAGDPARVVACVERARGELGFVAEQGLEQIIEDAWAGWAGRLVLDRKHGP